MGDTKIEGKDFSNEIYSISIGDDKGLTMFRLSVSLYLCSVRDCSFYVLQFFGIITNWKALPGNTSGIALPIYTFYCKIPYFKWPDHMINATNHF